MMPRGENYFCYIFDAILWRNFISALLSLAAANDTAQRYSLTVPYGLMIKTFSNSVIWLLSDEPS